MAVLNVLTTLYQDVNLTDVQDEKIPKFRRKTLSTTIKNNVDKIWQLLDSTLMVSYVTLYCSEITSLLLQSSSPFLLAAAMETISYYWLHMPLSSIFQSGLPLIVVSHLATESLRNIAIKALIVLVNRKVCVGASNRDCLQ